MSEKPQDEQLSGKVVCGVCLRVRADSMEGWLDARADVCGSLVEIRGHAAARECFERGYERLAATPANAQAPAPSLDARGRAIEAAERAWKARPPGALAMTVDLGVFADMLAVLRAAPSAPSDARAMLLEGALVRLLETQPVSFSDEQAAAIDYACDEGLRRRIAPKEGHRRSIDAPCSEGTPVPSDALRDAMGLLRLVRCCAGQDPLTDCTMFKAINAWRRKNDPEWRAPDGSTAPTAPPKGPQR